MSEQVKKLVFQTKEQRAQAVADKVAFIVGEIKHCLVELDSLPQSNEDVDGSPVRGPEFYAIIRDAVVGYEKDLLFLDGGEGALIALNDWRVSEEHNAAVAKHIEENKAGIKAARERVRRAS